MTVGNVIEPFDPARHDRAAFSSGVRQVDNFFQKTANKLARAGNLRLFVMTSGAGELIGFYALNAHAVDYRQLPERFARNRPGHGGIPAAYISMIGANARFQGKGFGSDLLVDALSRIALASKSIGIAVAVMDVLDCGYRDAVLRRKALYESYGFQPMPSRPLRLFLPIAIVKELVGK